MHLARTFSRKLVKQKSNPKKYCSVLKIEKKKCYFWIIEKIPCISSLFHENKFETAFRVKADIFKYFFAKQCLLIHSDTSLPFEIQKKTKNSLYSVENILEIISN